MTRDEAREFAKVMQAYADGKDVQALGTYGNWYDVGEYASFVPSLKWRIKTEPREVWVKFNPNGYPVWVFGSELEVSKDLSKMPGFVYVRMRETTE